MVVVAGDGHTTWMSVGASFTINKYTINSSFFSFLPSNFHSPRDKFTRDKLKEKHIHRGRMLSGVTVCGGVGRIWSIFNVNSKPSQSH